MLTPRKWGRRRKGAQASQTARFFLLGAVGSDEGRGKMKQVLFVTIAASMLAGCNLPDIDLPAYTPRAAVSTADATAQHQQRPASPYEAGQPAENTGDYSNYF
jgi:hypothetical protein